MNIQEYIESGVLEAYVLGSASEAEARELLHLKKQHPEIARALNELETDLERIAGHMAIVPPPGTWPKIEASLGELVVTPAYEPKRDTRTDQNQYIEVEAESNQMRVNKAWKWVLVAVFILGKIFLACAIYFYLENRQARQQIQELKTELKQEKR